MVWNTSGSGYFHGQDHTHRFQRVIVITNFVTAGSWYPPVVYGAIFTGTAAEPDSLPPLQVVWRDGPRYTCQHFSLTPGLRWGSEKLSFKPGLIYSFILFWMRHLLKAKCDRKTWFCSTRGIFDCSWWICVYDLWKHAKMWHVQSYKKAWRWQMFSNISTSITSTEIKPEFVKMKPCLSTFPWKSKKNFQISLFREVEVSNDKGFRCNSVKLMAALC